MKKLVNYTMIAIILASLIGCGDERVVNGRTVDTHGLFTLNEAKKDVEYKTIVGNVIWGVILIETVIAPIYFFGFSLYEPVGPLEESAGK